jgi:peptidoglycan/xylan/chitin deacetylase (PgdA/CDA1 family)
MPSPELSHVFSASANSDGWNWRELVAQTAYRTGALRLLSHISQKYEVQNGQGNRLPTLRRVSQPKYSILCYHRVGTEGIPYYSTLSPLVFEAQMRFLRENFRVISLEQLCHELKHTSGGRHGVAVTLDDGYSDLYTYALPILRKYEIPATIYLSTDCIETGEVAWYDRIFLALLVVPGEVIELPIGGKRRFILGSPQQRVQLGTEIVLALRRAPAADRDRFCAALDQQVSLPGEKLAGRMLSWGQVHEMRSAGIFFGSHTLSHPVLSSLTAQDIQRELAESKRILEVRLGEPVLDFAYPFGKTDDYGPLAQVIVASCGYRSAVTTNWGINTPGVDMHSLRRLRLGDERKAAKFGLQLHREFLRAYDPPAFPDRASLSSPPVKNFQADRSGLEPR